MQTAHCAMKLDNQNSVISCYFRTVAPRALVFRPLVQGNEALGTRLRQNKLSNRRHSSFKHCKNCTAVKSQLPLSVTLFCTSAIHELKLSSEANQNLYVQEHNHRLYSTFISYWRLLASPKILAWVANCSLILARKKSVFWYPWYYSWN